MVVEHFLYYRKVSKLQRKSQRRFMRKSANIVIWPSFLLPMLELEMFWRYLSSSSYQMQPKKKVVFKYLMFFCLFLGPKSSWMLCPASWEGREPSGACCDWNCPCGYGWGAGSWYGHPVIGASIAVWGAKYPPSSPTGTRSSLYFEPKGDAYVRIASITCVSVIRNKFDFVHLPCFIRSMSWIHWADLVMTPILKLQW